MDLKAILEAILFASQKPMTPRELREVLTKAAEDSAEAKPFKKTKEEDVLTGLETLDHEYQQLSRSYRLVCVAGSWQFVSQPEYFPWLRALVGEKARPPRLSQPALETLAIVAYRQPVTRAEIEQIRGVSVDGVMQTLLERGLIETAGRADVIGRPMTYGTTPLFLEYFGLRALEDMPAADELRRIVVEKPEVLLTVEPGLASTPPEPLRTEPPSTRSPEEPSHAQSPLSSTEAPGQESASRVNPSEPPPGR